MKNLLTSLKKLGKKMTGSDVAGGDLVTVVDNIADGYTGGGGGGDNRFIVTFTPGSSRDDGGFNITADKTIAECYEAYQNGSEIIGVTINSSPLGPAYQYHNLIEATGSSESSCSFSFYRAVWDGTSNYINISRIDYTTMSGVSRIKTRSVQLSN